VRFLAGIATFTSLCQAQLTFNSVPSREVGQPRMTVTSGAPNYVEGRELQLPQSVAVDTSLSPPALYIADYGNNRVLGYRNATGFQNGAKADLVIGQPDALTTVPQGPSSTLAASGLTNPVGLAVDKQGNLYVVDAGNNRILRFAKPFSQPTSDLVTPDMVIGQPNFRSNTANNGGVSASTIFTSTSSQLLRAGLTFDTQGNLWFADSGNNRVLRYPASVLSGPSGPAADLVIGQTSFTNNLFTIPSGTTDSRQIRNQVSLPSDLAFDPSGRLFVSDSGRVLVFTPPFSNGMAATRMMGVYVPPAGQGVPVASENTLGANKGSGFQPAQGVFFVGNNPWVVDTPNHRILRYDAQESWPAESTQFSPSAKGVLGQPNFTSSKSNAGQTITNAGGFNSPSMAVYVNNELYVVDSGNHRVVVLPVSASGFGAPTRVLGQDNFINGAVNLVEGREFFFRGGSAYDGAGLAVDSGSNPPPPGSTPPHLFVADTYNHRVLGFKDVRNVKPGDKADLVIGQPDLTRAVINWPTGDQFQPLSSNLFLPKGLSVDSSGALWVADGGNGRVLRFPAPFSQPAGQLVTADLVVGQSSFTAQVPDPSSRTMISPWGIAFTVAGDLLVSDAAANRVLFFRKPAGGDFSSGQGAEKVFGQADFQTISSGSDLNRFNGPRHIAVDTDDHLYVCDPGNARVLVFDRVGSASSGASAAKAITSFSNPQGVYISPTTGEVWVADAGRGSLFRFPPYDNLLVKPDPQASIASNAPYAVTLDGFGNLIAAEGINRVAFWFPGLNALNAANYAPRPLAPGTIASIFPKTTDPNPFGTQSANFTTTPVPTTLADLQVLVNDTPSPLFYAGPSQINFVVPGNAPSQGTADVIVLQKSTGRIMAASSVAMAPVSPGLFTAASSGEGQISAINYHADGKVDVNTSSTPAAWGDTVALYGTGQGLVTNMPADGVPASGQLPTATKPRLFINTQFYDSAVSYSGLAPTLVGVWQVNFVVPNPLPEGPNQVLLIFNSVQTNVNSKGAVVVTTIAVKKN
jgi:uncharacterized protein (TIGR03437 family)